MIFRGINPAGSVVLGEVDVSGGGIGGLQPSAYPERDPPHDWGGSKAD